MGNSKHNKPAKFRFYNLEVQEKQTDYQILNVNMRNGHIKHCYILWIYMICIHFSNNL